jgi:hypothetical protein
MSGSKKGIMMKTIHFLFTTSKAKEIGRVNMNNTIFIFMLMMTRLPTDLKES